MKNLLAIFIFYAFSAFCHFLVAAVVGVFMAIGKLVDIFLKIWRKI